MDIYINAIVRLFDLDVDPRGNMNADSYNVKCPFCGRPGENKYKMNINVQKNCYFCVKCSDGKGTSVMDLYSRLRFGKAYENCDKKEVYRSACRELESNDSSIQYTPITREEIYDDILPANNDILDAAYSALLTRPYFRLTRENKENLMKRGLSEAAIIVNSYASIKKQAVINHPSFAMAKDIYYKNELNKEKLKYPKIAKRSDETMIAGFLIANDIRSLGISVANVPGFFTLKDMWFFNLEAEGIGIPSRNINGKILGIQVRKDTVRSKADFRYMTVSSKGLPSGVTTHIARIHCPIENTSLSDKPNIIITEGPLKADVACHLKRKPGFYFALQGVNNTKGLDEIARYLSGQRYTKVNIAFDMDRLGNPQVARAEKKIGKIFNEYNIEAKPLYWEKENIKILCSDMEAFFNANGLDWILEPTWLETYETNAATLIEAGFDLDPFKWRWEKGIDDFLLYEKNNINNKKKGST